MNIMPSAKFEPAIHENEQPQAYALGRAVAGVGFCLQDAIYFSNFVELENPGFHY
jgi:hypothetical protein